MSETTAAGDGPGTDSLSSALSGTATALRAARSRRDATVVGAFVTVGYLVAYLTTVGDLSFAGAGGPLSVRVVDDLSVVFRTTGFFRFEAVALVEVGHLTVLISPLNLAVGGGLAALVGANGALSYLAVVQPRACGLEASSGALASVPALLSGAACCGPTVLLVIGVQASATIVTGFQLLVPLAFVLLAASLFLVGRTVDPSLLDTD